MKEKAPNYLKNLIPISQSVSKRQTVYQHSTVELTVSKILFFLLNFPSKLNTEVDCNFQK